jgi:branched-chain amino acid aminotransferase
MQAMKYIWHNGEFVRWEDAKIHLLSHALHYGSAAFEGIRVYETERGPAVFRLDEHIDRLVFSANVLNMQLPYSKDELISVTKELVMKNEMAHGYIRPIAFYGYGTMTVNPTGAAVEVAIATWPWGAYLPHPMLNVKTSKYLRIHPQSTVTEAKLSGHYINCILANLEIQGTDFQEAIFLDTNGNITEGSGENFFIVKDNIIYTPKLGWILPGITRQTLMMIAEKHGYKVVEKDITLEEAYQADEGFFTGTAAEVTPIHSIDHRVMNSGEVGPVSAELRAAYHDVVHAKNPDFLKYVTFIA